MQSLHLMKIRLAVSRKKFGIIMKMEHESSLRIIRESEFEAGVSWRCTDFSWRMNDKIERIVASGQPEATEFAVLRWFIKIVWVEKKAIVAIR